MELLKAKPGDMQQLLVRDRAGSMKLVRKLSFFWPKSAIMVFIEIISHNLKFYNCPEKMNAIASQSHHCIHSYVKKCL